jgi:nucleoside 2-deoxyribosyltransferase
MKKKVANVFIPEPKPVCYLGGAIDKVDPEFSIGWRKKATAVLEPLYKIIDPTAGKDLYAPGVNTDVYTPAQIVETDLDAIRKSDILLVEISRDDIPYHGTSMEIVYGRLWGKDIIVWGGCRSYWVRYHADHIFDTLEEAVEYITSY